MMNKQTTPLDEEKRIINETFQKYCNNHEITILYLNQILSVIERTQGLYDKCSKKPLEPIQKKDFTNFAPGFPGNQLNHYVIITQFFQDFYHHVTSVSEILSQEFISKFKQFLSNYTQNYEEIIKNEKYLESQYTHFQQFIQPQSKFKLNLRIGLV